MDIFEKEYTEGLRTTAADQFLKLAAAIDGSDIMGKLNPTGEPDHPAGTDARSLDSGLAIVERLREGQGKVTAEVDKRPAALTHTLHRDVAPLLTGGLQETDANDVNSVTRMKLAALRNFTYEQMLKTAASAQSRNIVVNVPGTKFSKGEKAGLLTAGSVLGSGGIGLGLYGAYKAHQAKELGNRAMTHAAQAGKNIAEQATIIGDKVSRAAEDLSATSKQVSRAVEPAVAVAERGRQAKEQVQQGVGRVRSGITGAVERAHVPAARARERLIEAVAGARRIAAEKGKALQQGIPASVRSVGSRIAKLVKRGAEDTPVMLMMKVAAEGQVRTLEGWSR